MSNMEEIHHHYLDEAATYIQKIWRGYYTRKVLAQYL
jgi:myosin heavy subunit